MSLQQRIGLRAAVIRVGGIDYGGTAHKYCYSASRGFPLSHVAIPIRVIKSKHKFLHITSLCFDSLFYLYLSFKCLLGLTLFYSLIQL